MIRPINVAGDVVRSLRHAGLDAVREFVWRTYFSVCSSMEADPVLEADWDLLVVLDACRSDLFAEVLDERQYDGLHVDETRISPGSSSVEWMERVFCNASDDALGGVAYVSGNPYTAEVIETDRFGTVAEVWRDAWDDDRGTIPPQPITDRAIALGRSGEYGRMIVHYMQPHFPSLADPNGGRGVALTQFGKESMSVWEELRFGRLNESTAWERYRANLEYVLGEVESLLKNVDAELAVVTADHGNAVGEWGIYGHPSGVSLPCLREVPWCETTATDRRSRAPADRIGCETHDETAGPRSDVMDPREPKDGDGGVTNEDERKATVEERLEQLGYRT